MEWSKLKNLIILILALVNGFLLISVVSLQRQSRRYTQSALTQAEQILEQNGISIDQEILNRAADSTVPFLTSSRDLQRESDLAHALLGEHTVSQNLSGGLYTYTSEQGSVFIRSSGEITVSLSDCFADTSDFTEHAVSLLSQLDLDCELIGESWQDPDLTTLTFCQLINGVPLYNCQISLEYTGSQLTSLEGTLLLSSSLSSGSSTSSLDLPTAVVRFSNGIASLGDVCSEVTEFRLGYSSSQSFSDQTQLIPTWLISTDIADYYLEGLTGELTRAP